jgi:hypothetical protein
MPRRLIRAIPIIPARGRASTRIDGDYCAYIDNPSERGKMSDEDCSTSTFDAAAQAQRDKVAADHARLSERMHNRSRTDIGGETVCLARSRPAI